MRHRQATIVDVKLIFPLREEVPLRLLKFIRLMSPALSVVLFAPALAQLPPVNTSATPPPGPIGAINAPSLFTDKERASIVAYWQAPGRYTIAAPAAALTDGPFQVRLTAEGSAWFLNYQKAVGAGGKFIPPTRDARPTSGPYTEWDAWVSAKVAYDRALSQQAADNANKLILNRTLPAPVLTPPTLTPPTLTPPTLTPPGTAITSAPQVLVGGTSVGLPPAPGPIPAGLLAAAGNPPPFAGVVCPLLYTVSFDKADEVFAYTDNVKLRERYAYYRFPRGVVSYGKQLKDMEPSERDALFRAAGFTESDQRIFSAVSKLEGGFETVQTYDTGYVSIGFIQFVTLGDGRADLSNVLREMKTSDPKSFQEDFRRFGIDISPDLTIIVIDPATGAELSGNPAVLKIIDDKRLTAVFQRAGRKTPFRVAQIKIARAYYWPVFDPLTVSLPDGSTFTGTIGDVVKSEAGLATLLDRKINVGNLRTLPAAVAQCMASRGCKSFVEVTAYEKDIISTMKYRTDFLADVSLSQPSEPPTLPVPPVFPKPASANATYLPIGPSVPAAPVTSVSNPDGVPSTIGDATVKVSPQIAVPALLPIPGASILPSGTATPKTPPSTKNKDIKDTKGKDTAMSVKPNVKTVDSKTKPAATPTATPTPPITPKADNGNGAVPPATPTGSSGSPAPSTPPSPGTTNPPPASVPPTNP